MIDLKRRLVTRSDFDGLVCAVLLRELELVDEITFVHPKDMQDGKVAISDRDITTNLPYVEGVHLAFDHHSSELTRIGGPKPNLIIDPAAPSAARVVYNHFGGRARFPTISDELMNAVDQADSANFTEEDILAPTGWTLLNFIMDPRTGLGRFSHFGISNYDLMHDLVAHCLNPSIEEILKIPDVEERVYFYLASAEQADLQIRRTAARHGNLVVVDLRRELVIHPCNRFLVYALFRDCNISIHALPGIEPGTTVFATGKSILDRSSKTNVGLLMLEYGGGGHEAAGTCQIPNADADRVLAELIARINQDG